MKCIVEYCDEEFKFSKERRSPMRCDLCSKKLIDRINKRYGCNL